jgi:hypothetical protein
MRPQHSGFLTFTALATLGITVGCVDGDDGDLVTSADDQGVATSLARPLQAAAWVAPPVYNGKFSGVIPTGDNTVAPNPTWNIAQWGTPLALQPKFGPASGWINANNVSRVQYYATEASGTNVYEFAQNGNTGALPCNTEFDLFLGTNDPQTYAGKPDGFVQSAPLSTLTAATMSVGTKVTYEQFNRRCALNFAGYVSAIILTNPTAGQTLFYQIYLRDSRGTTPNMAWCPDYENSANGAFCVDDAVTVLGGTRVLANSVRVNNTLNVLPRIKTILASAHKKANANVVLDRDPAHWMIQNVYIGQLIQGGMIPTSRWYNYSFTVQ